MPPLEKSYNPFRPHHLGPSRVHPRGLRSAPDPASGDQHQAARHGTLRRLLDVYDHCALHRIPTYGGGMDELAVGREQIQYLASLFHPDAPNDVAPVDYHAHQLSGDLPPSPLRVEPAPKGFRIAASSS
jgi:hypothetical protein